MATLTIDFDDNLIPRFIAGYKRELVEGEAVDINDPTGLEISEKMKQIAVKKLKEVLKNCEVQNNRDNYIFDDPIID